MMRCKLLLVTLLILLGLASISLGQNLRGQIDGIVKDPQGKSLPNAAVKVTNMETGEVLNATSSAEGTFTLIEVKPGFYKVETEITGFKKALVEGVTVQVATTTNLTIDLQLGSVNEEVTIDVDDVQEVINTSNAEIGEVIDRQKILELPLDGRNPFELAALNAGVQTKANSDGEVTSFSINGNRTTANNLTVDGVNASDNFIKSPANITLGVIPVSVESVGEFRVTTSLPAAEFGRGSAQINSITASGSNNFRGSLFNFHRNTVFNANNFFNNSTILEDGSSVPREPLIRNQFGGRLGGRIIKDKAFFFVSYEAKRESRGLTRNRLVYTQEALNGIYRYVKGLPTTPANAALATQTAPAGTANNAANNGTCRRVVSNVDEIPNGAICVQNLFGIPNTNRYQQPFDPTVMDFMSVIPLPNNFQIGDGLNTGGYRFNAKVISPTDQFTTRLDYRFNDKHSFEAVFNYGDISFNGDYINSGEPAFPESGYRTRNTIGRGLSGTFRSLLSQSLINEFRMGAQLSTLSFGNTADFSRGYRLDLGTVFDPENDFIASNRNLRTLQWTDNLTYLRGNHTFKTGGEIRQSWARRYTFAGTLPLVDFGSGNPTGYSQASHFRGSTTDDYLVARLLANNLTGALGDITQVFNIVNANTGEFVPFEPERRQYSNWEFSMYLQDSWRFRPNLTLSLGVRYEVATAAKEANNLALLPLEGSAALYGISGNGNLFKPGVLEGSATTVLDFASDGKLFNADKNNFAPVIGVAWDPFKKGKTSIRGGYRMSYTQGATFNAIDGTLGINEGLTVSVVRAIDTGYLRDGFAPIDTPTFAIPAIQSIQTNSTVDFRAFDENLRTPYMHDFSFGIQHEIFKGTSLEVRYVGNRGKGLFRSYDVNEVNIFAVDPKTGQSFLDAFKIAQTNLAACRANLDICATDNFAYNPAIAGSLPNPLMGVLLDARPTEYTNSNYITRIAQGRAGDMADYISRVRLLNGVRGVSFYEAVNRGDLPINFFRANPNVRGAQLFTNGSKSAYDSLQIELTRRLKGGWRFQTSYTFAKGLSDFTGSLTDTNSFLTLRDTHREYAQYNNTHQFLANAIYQLPFGRGRKFLRRAKGITGGLISGWQVSTIVKFTSGDPLDLLSGRGTYNRDDRSASNTVDTVGNLSRDQLSALLGIRTTATGVFYIDPNLAPGSTSDTSQIVFLNPEAGNLGSLGLGSIYGPSYFNTDFSVLKRTRISENVNVEFRGEIFNLFNTVNFNNPNTSINSANFGRVTSIVGKPRIMQFALRLNF